ncbi:MAG: Mur ligase family protein [Candidatus Thalassarchaeaceae archaeon]|jgi:dihydrofolate synthase/folylpolyglutamate synthase|nr:Mur ligase family protein [Candidatus Thalassarchaeaceae archaeon]
MDDSRTWLNSLKSMGMRKGIESTAALLTRLGMPQHSFPSIHVAGSNGKGTCCAILSNAITLSGTCTGLFTSPHLWHVNERIRIDGVPITNEMLDACLSKIKDAALQDPPILPTFYEATFLAAMIAFSENGVQRAVIETGLGGRYDATRLVDADCCILTEISLEHTEILGNTLAEIADEKVAIIRQGRPFIASWTYDKDAREVIENAVNDHQMAWWWRADRMEGILFDDAVKPFRETRTDFDGWIPYKEEAAMLAKNALLNMGLFRAANEIPRAITHTHWPGRMQWIEFESVPILLDAAHNPSGMERTCEEIRFQKSRDEAPMPGVILVGCTNQNDLHEFIHPLVEVIVEGQIEHVVVTQPSQGRRPPVDNSKLAKVISEQGLELNIELSENPLEAFEIAHSRAIEIDSETPPPVLCIGSLYLIGDILNHLDHGSYDAMSILVPPEGEDGVDPVA